MLKKGIVIFSVAAIILTASFFAGYFVMKMAAEKSNSMSFSQQLNKNGMVFAKQSDDGNRSIVDGNTKIIKVETYELLPMYQRRVEERANEQIIGYNLEKVKKYFEEQGYKDVQYSSENNEIIALKKISNLAPSNCYIIKADEERVYIYKSDQNGNMIPLKHDEISIDDIDISMQNEIKNGKVFEEKEKFLTYINEDLELDINLDDSEI